MWFIYAFLSSVFASFRKVNDKQLSHDVHHLHLAWMMRAAALPITGLLAALTGHFLPEHSLSPAFWISIIVSTCITAPLDTAVYLQSLKHGQLSKTAPLLSLYPTVMLVTGALFLGQTPSIAAIIAVLIIVMGVYVLNTSRGNGNVAPQHLGQSRYAVWAAGCRHDFASHNNWERGYFRKFTTVLCVLGGTCVRNCAVYLCANCCAWQISPPACKTHR